MTGIDAVTFDFWDTLMYVEGEALRDQRLRVWMEVFEAQGLTAELRHLEAAHLGAFDHYQDAWKANRQYRVPDAVDHMLEILGIDAPVSLRDELIEAFSRGGHDTAVRPTENIDATLRSLKQAGVRIGIVCDIGLTPSPVLLGHLDRCGLLPHFDAWSFSDHVGVYKPSPAIFHHALGALGGITPERAAHVGDRRRTDVGGARQMGMTAVRYAGVFDDTDPAAPDAVEVIFDHRDLLAVLGLG